MKVQNLAATFPPKKSVRLRELLPDIGESTLDDFFNKYNLLGYDNGDGELSCSIACYDSKEQKLSAQPLTFKETILLTHVPNILAFYRPAPDKPKRALLVSAEHIGTSPEIYYNFKRCPPTTDGKYPCDANERTYGELMGHSFACAIEQLIRCNSNSNNPHCFDPKKETIIAVGRPSSKGWENVEEEYKKILAAYLKDYFPTFHEKIKLLILPEGLAAMAGVLELKQEKWLHSFIQILDLGSSTFDLTTITVEGLLQDGEDSFQFGGNQLDKAMAEYGDCLYFDEYKKSDGYSIAPDPRKTAALRFKKEACYGDNGANLENPDTQNAYLYVVYKGEKEVIMERTKTPKKFTFSITPKIMENIVANNEHLEALECHTDRLIDNAAHYKKAHVSWEAACTFVMEQFYNKTKDLIPKDPKITRRLILTGGVSHMPEVREIAKKVFEIEDVETAANPSESVSNGLTLILGNEIIKKSILKEFEQSLPSKLPGADTLYRELVSAAAESDLDYYQAVIELWAEGAANKDLGSCIEAFGDPGNGTFEKFDGFVKRACESWFRKNNIGEAIDEALKEKFKSLFPEHVKQFEFHVTEPDLQDVSPITLDNNFAINPAMFFDERNCPDNPYNTEAKFTPKERAQILKTFQKNRQLFSEGGELDLGNGYRVEVGNYNSPIEFEGRLAKVDSISHMYARQLNPANHVSLVQTAILDEIRPQIREFVESLTYYLAIS